MIIPIIKSYKASNKLNAFILGSIFQSIVFSLAFILKDYIDKLKINRFFNFIVSVLYIFIITLISFGIMYIIFDFGGGMLIS